MGEISVKRSALGAGNLRRTVRQSQPTEGEVLAWAVEHEDSRRVVRIDREIG